MSSEHDPAASPAMDDVAVGRSQGEGDRSSASQGNRLGAWLVACARTGAAWQAVLPALSLLAVLLVWAGKLAFGYDEAVLGDLVPRPSLTDSLWAMLLFGFVKFVPTMTVGAIAAVLWGLMLWVGRVRIPPWIGCLLGGVTYLALAVFLDTTFLVSWGVRFPSSHLAIALAGGMTVWKLVDDWNHRA